MVESQLPGISDEIVETVGDQVPEYSRPLEGSFGRGVYRGVGAALGQFVALIRNPEATREAGRSVYVELGRGELRQGRTLDALQSAYRVGARIAWRRLAAAGVRAGLDQSTLNLLAESIFAFIDELSSDSVDGYAAALSERQGERLHRHRQLVSALLKSPAASGEELRDLARAADWRIPATAAVLACHQKDLAEITRRLPVDVISATVESTGCIVVPDPAGPGRPRQLETAVGDLSATLGPESDPASLEQSWRIARLALGAADSGSLEDSRLLSSDRHLVDLAIYNSRELIGRIQNRELAPMNELTPKARARMTDTVRAYIDQRGNAAEMARALQIHPQTARYRLTRLRELFGDRLDDPDGRLALELSLRLDDSPAEAAL